MLTKLLRAVVATLLLFGNGYACAQGYPAKQIRLVVPYPPGASTDIVARMVAQKVSEDFKQPVVVENRGGASGNLGSDFVSKAAPDGYTFLLGTDATHSSNPYLFKNFPFDVIKDTTPITMAAKNILVLVANPKFPPNNVRELIQYAKQHPGTLSYGSSGTGSPHHLAGEMLNEQAGIDLTHIPYKGGGPAVVDVLGGQIPLVFASLVSVTSYVQAGKLKVLAVTEPTRYPGLLEVQTVAETLPGFEMSSWLGFFGPPKMSAPVLARLNEAIVKALAAPESTAKLEAQGLMVVANSPEQFASQQKAAYEKRGKIIKAIGIQPE